MTSSPPPPPSRAGTGRAFHNPRTGQTKVIHVVPGDDVCQIESWNDPHMPAEPHHRHPKQETRFWVLSGQLAFLLPLVILLYPIAYARGYRATYPQYHHGDAEAPPTATPVDAGKV